MPGSPRIERQQRIRRVLQDAFPDVQVHVYSDTATDFQVIMEPWAS